MKNAKYIHIGEYFCSSERAVISTVLGPCVAVCLYDKYKRIGGMNHILIPGKASNRNYSIPTRYGLNAMEVLINEMMHLGVEKKNLTAKVFGGAAIFFRDQNSNLNGLKNVEFIIDYLIREGIPITNYNIGGHDTRRIYYHTYTNEVILKRIKSNEAFDEFSAENIKRKMIEEKIKYPGKTMYFD